MNKTSARSSSVVLLVTVMLSVSSSQQPRWIALPNAPFTSGKIDDLYFINPDTGWAAVRSSSSAVVYKTTDGGSSWSATPLSGTIRSIRFTDARNGWLGSLTFPYLRKTTDGGATWEAVSNLPPGPTAVCGLFALDSLHIFGVGAYDPNRVPYFFKTTNGGASWSIKDLTSPTAFAGALVDLYFFSPDTGLIVGASPDGGTDLLNKKAVVLRTTNGGFSWNPVYQGTQVGQLCWKILFPTPTTGYVAIEPFFAQGQTFIPQYLKTTDRGAHWTARSLPPNTVNMQGLQFLSNGQRGWAGGFGDSYETTDGGLSWTLSFGRNLNRFRMFGDTLGYASGQTIYKYTTEVITSVAHLPSLPAVLDLDQNYPNPFNPNTTIEFKLNEISHVKLTIIDALGREVATLINEELDQGRYRKHWDAGGFPSGTYYYRLVTPVYTRTRKMVLVK